MEIRRARIQAIKYADYTATPGTIAEGRSFDVAIDVPGGEQPADRFRVATLQEAEDLCAWAGIDADAIDSDLTPKSDD